MITLLLLLALTNGAQAAPKVHDILDPNAIKRSVDPCDNFYQFACGGWIDKFQLPPDKSRYWRQGSVLTDHVEEDLNALLAKLAAGSGNAKSDTDKKLGAFYSACMSMEGNQAAELKDLKDRLKKLEDVHDKKAVAERLAQLDLWGSQGLFSFYADQDPKESGRMIAFVDRGGMNLPDPDYYLKDDAKSREIRERYLAHIAHSFQLVGENESDAKKWSKKILAMETELAKHSLKKDDRRDMEKRFHPMDFAGLKSLAPAVDWDAYIQALNAPVPTKINVVEPEFLKALSSRLADLKSGDLVAWLKFDMIQRSSYYIAGPLQKEYFAFWKNYLQGQKEMPPQWKYCTQTVAGNMSEALGKAYVASVPNAETIRRKTESMYEKIIDAFGRDVDSLAWMDQSTRANAKKKLAKLARKIGWPKHWRDYGKLQIGGQSFYDDEVHSAEFEVKRNLGKIGKPTDRTEWDMSVWEANAYYSDSNNEIVLPLGELVPPVFDPKFSDGANYGSLGGSTIGHELTHGFDDAGKDMDADGNFVTWWSSEAKKKFDQGSACFIKQTESYEIIPGSTLRIRGKATLGENLADVGGAKLGLMALKEIMKKRKPAAKFEGFDELQQYFIGYAQGWCSKITDEKLRDQLLTDFHPPADFRVNQVLANQPEFAEAFQCKPGSKMAPQNRCSLW